MGNSSSKSVDFKKNIYIIFDTYPNIDYRNGSQKNLLEQNIYYKTYMQKLIIRAFRRISDVKLIFPHNGIFIINKLDEKNNIIYYEINVKMEFIVSNEKKTIELPNISSSLFVYNLFANNVTDKSVHNSSALSSNILKDQQPPLILC